MHQSAALQVALKRRHWAIENEGVAPDIEVGMTPKAVVAGGDPQLGRAVEVVLERLEDYEPVEVQKAPAYPGVTEE